MTSPFGFLWLSMLFISALLPSATVRAESWTMIPAESRIGFSGSQTSTVFEGTFDAFSVQINYNPDQPETAFVRAVIKTASAKTGETQRDEALPGKDWFFVSMFPSATFEAHGFSAIKDGGGGQFSTVGTLEIKGVKQNIVLPFSLSVDGRRATMRAELTLNRADFGIGTGPWADGKWVGLNVKVSITIVAMKEGV